MHAVQLVLLLAHRRVAALLSVEVGRRLTRGYSPLPLPLLQATARVPDPLPVLPHDLLEGHSKGPDGEAVDDGVRHSRQHAEAERAELQVEVPLEIVGMRRVLHEVITDPYCHRQGQPEGQEGQYDVARALGGFGLAASTTLLSPDPGRLQLAAAPLAAAIDAEVAVGAAYDDRRRQDAEAGGDARRAIHGSRAAAVDHGRE